MTSTLPEGKKKSLVTRSSETIGPITPTTVLDSIQKSVISRQEVGTAKNNWKSESLVLFLVEGCVLCGVHTLLFPAGGYQPGQRGHRRHPPVPPEPEWPEQPGPHPGVHPGLIHPQRPRALQHRSRERPRLLQDQPEGGRQLPAPEQEESPPPRSVFASDQQHAAL